MTASFDLVKRYGSADRLREAAARSPVVAAEIQAELEAIKGISSERCVVTQEYGTALRAAIEGQPASVVAPAASPVAAAPPMSLEVGDYKIMQDKHGGLQIKANDGTMIPLVQKDEQP